jgi:hypothetical protein
MSSTPTPTLLSVTATGNNTITLHFSEAMTAGTGNLIISGGHSQTYMTKDGLATRIVGAHDTRPVSASDSQVSYSGTDVVIMLTTPLEAGLTYSVTMGNNVLRTVADDFGFHSISSTSQFFFTTTATPHSAPSATVDAAIHFTDSGASSTDFVTSWDTQVVTGTYTGTLGANDFVQVSLDNGASWHKASASGNTWSYSGNIDTANLGSGQDSTFTSKILARVGNIYTLNSGTVSQAYTYDHQVPSAPSSSNFTLSSDSGTSSSDYITNVASQTIAGTIAGLSGSGLTVQISMSNGDTWDNATVSGNNWSAAVTLNQIGKVLVRVVDLAGNTSASSSPHYYDYATGVSLNGHALTLLPASDSGSFNDDHVTKAVSTVTLAVAGLTGLHIGDTIEIVDTSNGSTVVGHYTIKSTDLDGYGELGVSIGKPHNGGGDISNLNIPVDHTLDDGVHVLAAHVVDVAGNTGTAFSGNLSVTVDTSPASSMASVTPELVHTSTDDTGISSTDNLTKNASPTVSAHLSTVNGLLAGDVIKVLDGSTVVGSHTILAGELDGNGHISATSTDITLTTSLNGDGAHSLTLRVDDIAGNTGIVSSTPLIVTLDRLAPTIVSSSPGSTTDSTITELVVVFGEQVYISSGATVTLSNGTQAEDVEIPISAADLSTDGATLTIHLPGTLSAGTHYTVAMNGTIGDAAGNDTVNGDSLLFEFSTDDQPPPVVPVAPYIVPATVFTSSSTSFSGSFYSEDSSNKMQVSFDGTSWHDAVQTPIGGNFYTWGYEGALTTHDLQARIVDNGGTALPYLNYGNSVLHFGSSDNDTITDTASSAIVYSGLGSDTVTVGNSAHVTTGGDHTTIVAGDNATVVAGGTFTLVTVGSNATVALAGSGSTVQATGDGLLLAVSDGGSHSIVLPSLNVQGIVAGNGSETLNLTFNTTAFTLDSLHTTHAMTGIDIINMVGSFDSITVDGITDVTGLGVNTLYIAGDASTTVTVNLAHWTKDASPTGGYDVYHAVDNNAVTLLVGVNIGQTA